MTLPTLSDEQRAEALEKAAKARRTRVALKDDIASGKVAVKSLLEGDFGPYADSAEVVNKTKVLQVLQSVKGIGKVKAQNLMQQCEIAENRRLGGLGERQIDRLIEAIEDN